MGGTVWRFVYRLAQPYWKQQSSGLDHTAIWWCCSPPSTSRLQAAWPNGKPSRSHLQDRQAVTPLVVLPQTRKAQSPRHLLLTLTRRGSDSFLSHGSWPAVDELVGRWGHWVFQVTRVSRCTLAGGQERERVIMSWTMSLEIVSKWDVALSRLTIPTQFLDSRL